MGYSSFKKRFKRARALARHKTIHRIWEYGKYYGPGWSGGKHQSSIDYAEDPDAPEPVDALDRAAMLHDADYARARKRGRSPDAASDFRFAKRAMKTGTFRGIVGGAAVGAQGVYRLIRSKIRPDDIHTRDIPASPPPEDTDNLNNMSVSIARFVPPNKRPRVVRVKGSAGSTELEFSTKQAESAYFGVTSFERWPGNSSPLYHYAASVLRSIIKKHCGIDVESHGQYMKTFFGHAWKIETSPLGAPTAMTSGSPIYSIQFLSKYQRNEGGYHGECWTEKAFDLIVGSPSAMEVTFHSKASELAVQLLNLYCTRPTDAPTGDTAAVRELYGYHVVSVQDFVSNTNFVFYKHPVVRLDNQKVTMKVHTYIRCQNLTHAVSGTTGTKSFDAYGQNPLSVRLFHFKDPHPKLRRINYYDKQVAPNADGGSGLGFGFLQTFGGQNAAAVLMVDANGDGIIRPIDNTTGVNGIKRIPGPEIFTNCSRWSKGMMRPDEIRTHELYFYFHGYINKFFAGYIGGSIGTESGETDTKPAVIMMPSDSNNLLGTHCLFAFQQFMSNPESDGVSIDQIHLDVNVKRYTHVYLGGRTHAGMLPYKQDEWGPGGGTVEGVAIPANYDPPPATQAKTDGPGTSTDNDIMQGVLT